MKCSVFNNNNKNKTCKETGKKMTQKKSHTEKKVFFSYTEKEIKAAKISYIWGNPGFGFSRQRLQSRYYKHAQRTKRNHV